MVIRGYECIGSFQISTPSIRRITIVGIVRRGLKGDRLSFAPDQQINATHLKMDGGRASPLFIRSISKGDRLLFCWELCFEGYWNPSLCPFKELKANAMNVDFEDSFGARESLVGHLWKLSTGDAVQVLVDLQGDEVIAEAFGLCSIYHRLFRLYLSLPKSSDLKHQRSSNTLSQKHL